MSHEVGDDGSIVPASGRRVGLEMESNNPAEVADALEDHYRNNQTLGFGFALSERALVALVRVEFRTVPIELLKSQAA